MRSIPVGTGHPDHGGTRVEREEPTIDVEQPNEQGNTWVHIRQTIHLSVAVPVAFIKHSFCGGCGREPPLPNGREALEFILSNNDGARLCFPEPEDAKPERDGYPVEGWRRIEMKGGDDSTLMCPKCLSEMANLFAKKQKARRHARQPR